MGTSSGGRSHGLLEQLQARGATDARASRDQTWVITYAPSGTLVQVIWVEAWGMYCVSRWPDPRGAAESLGRFRERDMAVACALRA